MSEMNKGERTELGKVVRLRMKVAKANVDKVAAERKSQVEAQLATTYKKDDQDWAHITARAEKAVVEAKEELEKVFDERGIPDAFRPEFSLTWWRGEMAIKERRDEIRKAALSQVAADKKAALLTVEAWACERLEELAAGSLESGDAKAFLESLPSPEKLLPEVKVPHGLIPGAEE